MFVAAYQREQRKSKLSGAHEAKKSSNYGNEEIKSEPSVLPRALKYANDLKISHTKDSNPKYHALSPEKAADLSRRPILPLPS